MGSPDFAALAPSHSGPRPVFIGEVNPYSDRPWAALLDVPEGASGDRLRRLVCAIEVRRYRAFPRYDLCVGKWSAPAARARAAEIEATHPDDVLVLLGRKVVEAFGLTLPPFAYRRPMPALAPMAGIGAAVVLPHPSGLCRVWQAPGAFENARRVLAEALPGVPWGETLLPRAAPPRTCSNCGLVKVGNDCSDCGYDLGAES